MISLNKKFLFIHVPKTGGNSIQNILRNYSEDEIVTLGKHQDGIERFEVRNNKYSIQKHSTLSTYKNEIESNIYEPLFKFSTIRNPWDMCISFYFSPHRGKIEWYRDRFKEYIQTIPTIRHYIMIESMADKINRKFHIGLKSKTKPLDTDIDFLIRFENLNEDFNKVCDILEIPFVELPLRNKSTRSHYTEYFDDELIALIGNRFSDEIKHVNYIYGE